MQSPAVGDRVRLTGRMVNQDSDWMPEESLEVGSEGTVTWVSPDGPVENRQVGVMWDCGRSLALLPHDKFELVR